MVWLLRSRWEGDTLIVETSNLVRINQRLMPDDELIEFICNENQPFRRRVKVD